MLVPEVTNWHILTLIFCLTKTLLSTFSLFYLSLSLSSAHYNHSLSFSRHGSSRVFVSPSHCRRSSLPFFFSPLNPFFSLLLSFLFSFLSFSLFHPLFTWKRGSVVALCLLRRPVRFWSVGCLFVLFHSGHNRAAECQRVRVQSSLAPQCPCVYNGSHNLVIWFARSQ